MHIFNEKMQESWFSRKWFFIDIFFERDLKQIVYWIEILQNNNNIWINLKFFNDWNIDNDYFKKLKNCTCQKLLQLNIIHQKFINVNKFNSKIKSEHLTILTNVLKTLWLRRNFETSFFFDYKLMILSKHYYFI